MKSLTYFLVALFMTISISNSFGHSGNAPAPQQTAASNAETSAEAAHKRLQEIYALTKTNLSKSEKKELRAEVKQIRQQLENEPVLIISGSMLLLIIILLI